MPRRGRVRKREIPKDAVYGSVLVQKFINKMMMGGKKSIAEAIVYGSFDVVKGKFKKEPLDIFETAIKNITPRMMVKPRRVGGATYQVPVEVEKDRAIALAMQWLRQSSRQRPGKSMSEKLSAELMDAFNGTGLAVKKRDDVHRMAEANKAFAHFRW